MKVTVLGSGTSQGVPVIGCQCPVCQSLDFRDKRLRSSVHIEVEGKSIVIDSGPDFRQQMLRERISQLDALLFTHEHKDHTAGMDDIRSFNFLQEKDMPVYAAPRVIEQLKREFAYVFSGASYPSSIYKSFSLGKNNKKLKVCFKKKFKKKHNENLKFFYDAGQFYWGKKEAWLKKKNIFGSKSAILEIPRWRTQDINDKKDWLTAQKLFKGIKYNEKK